jgi:hypothetical protein
MNEGQPLAAKIFLRQARVQMSKAQGSGELALELQGFDPPP